MSLPWSQDREESWNAAWWRDDYSWAGLSKIRIGDLCSEPPREIETLQDYWRRDPTSGDILSDPDLERQGLLLTMPDGSVWHIAHLPPRGTDGSPLKSAFDGAQRRLLKDVITSRLLWASEYGTRGGAPALLNGVVAQDVEIVESTNFTHPIVADRSRWGFVRINGRFDELNLPNLNVGGLDLSDGEFRKGAKLQGLRTISNVDLSNCEIGARFDISRIVVGGVLDLSGTRVNGQLEADSGYVHHNFRLYDLVATATVDLTYLRVHGNTWLATSKEERAARFEGALVATAAEFGGFQAAGTIFGGVIDFGRCTFTADATFRNARLPSQFGASEGAFDLATFEQQADLRGISLVWLAAFAGTSFKQSVLFDQLDSSVSDRQFNMALRLANAETTRSGSFQQIERGARSLKSAMEGNRDKIREQRFYKYEIRARSKRQDLGRGSRAFAWLYVHASDCGLSVKRPLLVLLSLAVIMASIYFWASIGSGGVCNGLVAQIPAATEYSFSRAIPLNVWEKPASCTPLAHALAEPWFGLVLRSAAVLQSVASALLLFLSALAARRHFQIQ